MARTLEQVLNQNTKPIPVEPTKVLIPPVESKPISVSGDSGSDPGTNSQKELEKGAGGTVPRPIPNSKPVAVQPTTSKPVSAKPLTAKPVSSKPVSEPTVKPVAVQKVASTEPEVPSWKRTVRMAGEDSPVEAKIQKVFAQGTANAANELPDLDVKGILAEGYKSRIARDELVAAVPELGNGGLEKIEKFMRDPDLGEAYVKQIAADNIGGTTNPAKIYLDIQSGQRPDLKEKLDLATRTSDVIINNYAKQHNMDPEQLWTAAYQREFPLRQYLDSQLNNTVAAEANPDIILRGWAHRTGYIPELAGSKVTAVNRDARIKQAEDAALRAVTQFDYKLDPVNDKSQNIEGIDPAKDLGIAQPGETGFHMAQKVIEAYEADGGKPEWWNSFQQTNRGSRYFVLERTKELLSRWGVKAGDANHDEMARKAIQRAVFELASAKTVGLWIPPIILPDSLDPNDFSLIDALKPNVEIVGVALRKDGSAHVVRRAESAPSYSVNVIGAGESALAGAIKTAETNVDEDYKKELGEQGSRQTLAMGRLPMVPAIVAAQKLFGASDEEALAKPLEVADAAKMGILERDNLLQASMNSNWAQPEVSVDFTGETPKIKRSGWWKIIVAGAGGLAASILMPDLLGVSGDPISEAASTYRTIKDAGSVRRVESLLTEIAVNRAAAESLTTEAKAAVEAGDVEAASKLKAKAQEHWAKAKAAEGTAGPDRLLAEAASLEARGEYKAAEKVKAQAASAQGSGLRGEFPLIADHLDRMDAVIASKVGGTHPEIFDSALAESLPFADAEKAKLTLHPSDRRAQLEFGPSTRGQLEYSRLYDSGSHRQALDELAELEKSELRTRRLSENVGNQFEEIRTTLSKDVKDQQAVDELTSSYTHLYDDPEDWKKVWLNKRKDLASLSTNETAVRKYLSDRVSRQISELRQTTNDYFEAKYGIDVADKLSPKLSEADATALGISPEDYDRMFDSFENIQTWNHPQYIDSLVADEIAARKLADKTFTENVMAAYRKAKDLKVNAADFEAASNALSVANETRAAAAALARKQLLDQFQMSGDLLTPIRSSKQAVADAANSVWENERLVPTYAKDHQPLLPRIGRFLAQAGAGIVDEARKLTRGELKLGKSGRRFAGQLEAAFGITHDEAVAVSLIAEARARVWAAENAGKTVDDWFKEHIAEVVGYGSERKAKIKLKLKELAKSDEYGKITKKLIEIQSLERTVISASGKRKKIPAAKLKRIDALKEELWERGVDVKIGAGRKVDIAATTEDWLTTQSARFADTMEASVKQQAGSTWLEQNQNPALAQNPDVLQVFRDRADQPAPKKWYRIGNDHEYSELTRATREDAAPRFSSGRDTGFASGMYAYANPGTGRKEVDGALNPVTISRWSGGEDRGAAFGFQKSTRRMMYWAEAVSSMNEAERTKTLDLIRRTLSGDFDAQRELNNVAKDLASKNHKFATWQDLAPSYADLSIQEAFDWAMNTGVSSREFPELMTSAIADWGKHKEVHPVNIMLSRMGHDGIEFAGKMDFAGKSGDYGFVKFPPINDEGKVIGMTAQDAVRVVPAKEDDVLFQDSQKPAGFGITGLRHGGNEKLQRSWTAQDAARVLATHAERPEYRVIAQRLAEIIDPKEVFVIQDELVDALSHIPAGGVREFQQRGVSGRVAIKQRVDAKTVLHELMHSATSNQIQRYLEIKKLQTAEQDFKHGITEVRPRFSYPVQLTPQATQACKDLEDIMHILARDSGKYELGAEYGMTNLHEFVAEALSNPRFQKKLMNIPATTIAPSGLIAAGKNVWNAVVEKVRIILGLDTIEPSVLDHVLDATSKLIDDSVENRKFLEDFSLESIRQNWHTGGARKISPAIREAEDAVAAARIKHEANLAARKRANPYQARLDAAADKFVDLADERLGRELETAISEYDAEVQAFTHGHSTEAKIAAARRNVGVAFVKITGATPSATFKSPQELSAAMDEFQTAAKESMNIPPSVAAAELNASIAVESSYQELQLAQRKLAFEHRTVKAALEQGRYPWAALYQPGATKGAKGAVQFLEDQRAIIHAFENADVSTAIHEVGHIIRRDLPDNDLKVLEDWAGVKDGQWSVESEEKFARAFERYLYDGIAPTTYLKKTFEKIKTWMREIYSAVTNSPIDVEIPPHVRDVFDRALGKSSPTSKTLDSLTSSSRIPSAAEELSLQAARSGIHVTPDTIRDAIVSTGKFEFPISVNGKKTWTVKDFSKLELSLASKAEYQMAVEQPQLSLNLKKSQVVEEKPVDILRAKAAETNSLAAKVGVFVMFGGDAEETMRHMPGAVRRNAVDATRAVSGAWSDGLHLIAEDDLDSLAKFLGGEPTNFKAGRPVPTSGYNYLSNFYTDYRKYFDSLDEKTQQLIIAAIQNQIPERLMGNSKIDKAIKAALYGKNAPDGLDRLITVVGGVPRAAIQDGARLAPNEMKLLRLIAEGSGIVKPGEYLPVSLNMFEDAAVDLGKLKANGMVGSTEAVLVEPTTKALADTNTVLPPADQLALAWGSGQGVDAAKATILGLQQIYGKTGSQKGIAMLISHGAKKKGFDILVDSETALSAADEGIFKAFMNSELLPNNLQMRAEVIAKKFGINPDFVNVPTDPKFIAPRSAVDRIEGLSTYQFEEIKASQETADLGSMLKDASGSLTRYVHGRMTFGGMLVRQTQSFNQIFDHFTGMLKWAGARPAIVSSSRWAAQNLLAVSLWGVEIGRPLHLAQLASSFSGKEAAILEGTRKLIQSGSDKAANLIGRLMRVSKYRVEVNDVLEGGDKIIRVGDRIYTAQDLKDLFQRKGVFGTFAGTVVEKSIQRSGAKARTVFKSTWEKALYEASEKTKKGTSRMFELPVELMEGIAERERVGAAITLIECGMDPIQAAEITVNALYDFAGSMSSVDRNMWTKMILPFWAFQKNANMNFVNLMFSPMGAYRMNIVRKLYDRGAEAVSQILYSQQVDPYGIQPEAIPADSLKDYWMLRYQVEAYFGGTEKVPPEIRMAMRSIFANTSRTIDKGQLYNFSKDIEELFGTGDVNDDGKSNYDGSVRAHFINTYQAAQPPVDKSAESTYVRDRDTIRITTPIADTGMYEATRRYYNLVRPSHPFSEIVIPENDVMASYKWFGDWLATGIVLATHATSNIDMFGDEDDGTDFLFSSTPLKIIVDPTRAPLTSDVLSWFGSDTAYPKRADPKLAALMSSAFGVEYARVAAASDPFVGIPGTAMVAATQEDVQSVYHTEGVPGEYPSVATSPMEAKEERVYLAPGLQSFVFNMSPVGEFSDKFIAYEKTPLEDNTPYWGEILRWARGSLGVKTNEVETGPGRVKQAKAEEVRFDSSTVEPSSKK